MIDSDTKNHINLFLNKLNFLEQFHQHLIHQVKSKKLEIYCKKKVTDISSFKAQLKSQLTVTGLAYNPKDKWVNSEKVILTKKSPYSLFDDEKIIAEILKKEISFLKEYRIILNDLMIPFSIKKMLTNQVALIRKDITYIRQLQNSI